VHVGWLADDGGVGLVHVGLADKVILDGKRGRSSQTLPSTTMKLLSPLLLLSTLFSFSTSVYGQYYSAGWQPGQQAAREDVGARDWAPGDQPEGHPPPPLNTGAASLADTAFHWSKFLTEGPIGDALLKIGLNYTAAREDAERRKANMWDKRIPLITDDNYERLIVNETFSNEDEEKERVWFLVV
jgi:hypothetical protein